jgi:hypothetical protein
VLYWFQKKSPFSDALFFVSTSVYHGHNTSVLRCHSLSHSCESFYFSLIFEESMFLTDDVRNPVSQIYYCMELIVFGLTTSQSHLSICHRILFYTKIPIITKIFYKRKKKGKKDIFVIVKKPSECCSHLFSTQDLTK